MAIFMCFARVSNPLFQWSSIGKIIFWNSQLFLSFLKYIQCPRIDSFFNLRHFHFNSLRRFLSCINQSASMLFLRFGLFAIKTLGVYMPYWFTLLQSHVRRIRCSVRLLNRASASLRSFRFAYFSFDFLRNDPIHLRFFPYASDFNDLLFQSHFQSRFWFTILRIYFFCSFFGCRRDMSWRSLDRRRHLPNNISMPDLWKTAVNLFWK